MSSGLPRRTCPPHSYGDTGRSSWPGRRRLPWKPSGTGANQRPAPGCAGRSTGSAASDTGVPIGRQFSGAAASRSPRSMPCSPEAMDCRTRAFLSTALSPDAVSPVGEKTGHGWLDPVPPPKEEKVGMRPSIAHRWLPIPKKSKKRAADRSNHRGLLQNRRDTGGEKGVVAHTGFEPVISALRGRCPWPLDECASFVIGSISSYENLTGYIITRLCALVKRFLAICANNINNEGGLRDHPVPFVMVIYAGQRR